MKVRCAYDKLVSIKDLKSHPKNRNKHPADQIKDLAAILKYQGWRSPVKVSELSDFITAGHGRVMAAKLNGWEEVPVDYQAYDSEEQEYADVQADNIIASRADLKLDEIELDLKDFPDLDIHLLGLTSISNIDFTEEEKIYTDKIEIPLYVPKGDKPKLTDLVDKTKANSLIKEIEKSKLHKSIKDFLIAAAYRHYEFNYEQIAEYYSHANKETQNLFEKSALVIIDFNKAIENGLVKLTKDLNDNYLNNGSEDD